MIANGDWQMGCGIEEDVIASAIALSPTEQAFRPLVSRDELLHHGTSNSARSQPESKLQCSATESQKVQMGFSSEKGTEASDSQRKTTTSERQLGVRTENSMDLLEREGYAISKEFVLKPSELVRLLNSCGLGQVTSERKLYRHRQKAPGIEVGPRRIDLIAYCAWMHSYRHSRRPLKRRRVGNLEVITLGELRGLLESQNYRCALSGQHLTPDNFALDHIVPISEGGDFSVSNCQIVTAEVNRAKHTISQKAFIDMCVLVAQHAGQMRTQNDS